MIPRRRRRRPQSPEVSWKLEELGLLNTVGSIVTFFVICAAATATASCSSGAPPLLPALHSPPPDS